MRWVGGLFTGKCSAKKLAVFFSMACWLAGCAGYQTKVEDARHLLKTGQAQAAAEKLEPLAAKQNDDQLVYLFDYATALQQARDYKKSNEVLIKADNLSEVVDYHSLSRDAGSILLSEGMVQYKGEDYEKVLINAMMAVNFLLLHDQDNALVEARRLNEKLYKYKFEAKRNYEQNPFAFYLSALMWENDRNFDNALIEYTHTYDVHPGMAYLQTDLLRGAMAAQRPDELEKWRKAFPGVNVSPEWKRKDMGEVVLIFEQGWGPRKMPHPSFARIPKLYPSPTTTKYAELIVEGVGRERSQSVFSVQDVAIKTLDDAYAGLIAKRAAGLAAKAVIADQVRQKNPLLGELAWIGLNLADRADLRQWSTLPESFQIAKMYVPAGKYQVQAVGLSAGGGSTGENMAAQELSVQPHRKTFLLWRSYR